MAVNDISYVGDTNLLRFYIDNRDRIFKCDYIESIDVITHEIIKLNQDELYRLFNKYISDRRIYHEEKIFNDYILYKFYDVDVNEIDEIIRKSRSNQRRTKYNKPTQNNNSAKKVNRVNKFNGKKVIATLAVIATLFTAGSFALSIAHDKTPETETSTIASSEYETIEESTPEYVEPTTEEEKLYDQYILVNTIDETNSEKYRFARSEYYEIIEKYALMYGIDPELALAIACQERGTHSDIIDDGGALGLFQIQIEGRFGWDNKDVYAYNFETKAMEKYTIHIDEIKNVEQNIKAGIMIFQEALRRNDYDVARAIQEYNFGCENMQTVLEACYTESNPETKDNNLEWLNYRTEVSVGDPHYVEHVLQWVKNNQVFEITKKDGTVITCQFNNSSLEQTKSRV